MFTNATLLNEAVTEKIASLGNLYPILSIEGNEEETNDRRGKDVYNKVIKAMELLVTISRR